MWAYYRVLILHCWGKQPWEVTLWSIVYEYENVRYYLLLNVRMFIIVIAELAFWTFSAK
jgi:hypothetical protein